MATSSTHACGGKKTPSKLLNTTVVEKRSAMMDSLVLCEQQYHVLEPANRLSALPQKVLGEFEDGGWEARSLGRL